MGVMSYVCLNTNNNDEMKRKVLSNLPGSKRGCVCTAASPKMGRRVEKEESIPRPERRYRTILNITCKTYKVCNISHAPRNVRRSHVKKNGGLIRESSGVGVRDHRQEFEP
jgi:hypothetical protein